MRGEKRIQAARRHLDGLERDALATFCVELNESVEEGFMWSPSMKKPRRCGRG
jgi:hypothetical protein